MVPRSRRSGTMNECMVAVVSWRSDACMDGWMAGGVAAKYVVCAHGDDGGGRRWCYKLT